MGTCLKCQQPPCSRGLRRGHCQSCYSEAYRRGAHIDLPAVQRRLEDVVDDFLLLSGSGSSRAEIAARLGYARVNSLNEALRRAALAGDTRVPYRPRGGH